VKIDFGDPIRSDIVSLSWVLFVSPTRIPFFLRPSFFTLLPEPNQPLGLQRLLLTPTETPPFDSFPSQDPLPASPSLRPTFFFWQVRVILFYEDSGLQKLTFFWALEEQDSYFLEIFLTTIQSAPLSSLTFPRSGTSPRFSLVTIIGGVPHILKLFSSYNQEVQSSEKSDLYIRSTFQV